MLKDIGKTVGPSISSQIEKAIKQGIQNGAKNASIPQIKSGGGAGASSSSAYKEAVAALREQQKYVSAIYTIEKQRVGAVGQEASLLKQSRDQYSALARSAEQRLKYNRSLITDANEMARLAKLEAEYQAKTLSLTSQVERKRRTTSEANRRNSVQGRVDEAFANIPSTMINTAVGTITHAIAQFPVQAMQQFWNDAWSYANAYYDKLNEIRVVTGKTQAEANMMGANFRDLANELSVTSQDLIEGAVTYYRQGLSDMDVEERLIATTQYAKTAGISFDEAASMITASVNTIDKDARGVEMTAQRVADVFLYLGDNAATSGEEIGTAMSRSASIADAAGVSFEMLGAYIATVSERTRQDAGTIGTALNAIMSRLTSVKQRGFNEEDETKVNDVAKALNSVNIQLTDGQGQWRRIEDIFADVGAVWDTLDDKTRNYLATTLAGTRQQNVFRTLMADLADAGEGASRAMELYAGALESAGTASEKYSTYQESVTAAHEGMIASLERLYSLLTDSEVVKDFYDTIGALADLLYGAAGGNASKPSALEKSIQDYSAMFSPALRKNEVQGFIEEYASIDPTFAEDLAKDGELAVSTLMTTVRHRLETKLGEYNNLGKEIGFDESPFEQLIAKWLIPDGQLTAETYQRVADWFDNFVVGVAETAEEAAGDLTARLAAAKQIMNSAIEELAPEFKGQEKDIWENFFGDSTAADLTSETADEIQEYVERRVELYHEMLDAAADVRALMLDDSDMAGDFLPSAMVSLTGIVDTFNQIYGTSYDVADLITNNMNATESSTEGATEAVNEFYEAIAKGRKQEEYNARKEGGFAWEMESLKRMADQKNYKGILKFFEKIQGTDKTRWEDMTKEYGNLNTILDEIKNGNYDNALILIGQAMDQLGSKNAKETVESYKELNAELEKVSKNARLQEMQDNNFETQKQNLRNALGMEAVARYMGSHAGDIDVFSKHQAGTTADGGRAVITITPVTPDGQTILTPAEMDEYLDYLFGSDSVEGADLDGYTFANGKQASNLLANVKYLSEGEDMDAAIEEVSRLNTVLHELQEAYYGGEVTGETNIPAFLTELQSIAEVGGLAGLGEQLPGLLEAVAEYQEAAGLQEGEEGYESKEETQAAALERIVEILYSGATAWDLYAAAAQEASADTLTEAQEQEAAALLATASNADDLKDKFNSLSDKQQEYAAKNIKGVKEMLEGTQDYDEAIKDVTKHSAKLDADKLAKMGKVWKDTSKIIDKASEGGDEFNDVYAKTTKEAQKLSQAWGALNAIQSGSLSETQDLNDAYSTLASATGLDADSLRNDLSPALWMLQNDTLMAAGTVEYLANWLVTNAGIDLHNPNWYSELAALANSSDTTAAHVAALVQQLLQVSGSRLYLDGNQVKVSWGSGAYSPPSVRSGGGGGGSSGSSKSTEKTISEVEKMTDLMEKIQELFDFHQSMIQQIQEIYTNKGQLTDLIAVYREERAAILQNNKVLEENVRRLESLIPAQQRLVQSMDTSNEEYEDAAKDLDMLQKAHQEYSKQLLENVAALDELAEQIEDTYEEIRQKRITVENMILEAIEDREELEERMLEGRIDMEEEVMDAVIARYEKERDLIIQNAELQRDALERESELLDENLAKRKERNDLEKKQQELLEYEQQLVRISADPTRRAESDKLRSKIADLREELAWDTAEAEVEAQKDSIDQQIESLDEYIEYVERYYEDLFAHPKKLIAEVEGILMKTNEEIITWLKQNNDEFQNSSAAVQQNMLQTWESTLVDMRGEVETHWAEVEEIIAQGDDYIINFLIQNSAKYKEASATQAESYVAEWKRNLKDLEDAYKQTYTTIQAYSYVPIRMSTAGSSSGDSGGGGTSVKGNSSKNYEVYYADYSGVSHLAYSGSSKSAAQKAYSGYSSSGTYEAWKKGFATGGIADFTGPAWLDGTPDRPERVLSPYQTELFEDLVQSLHSIKTSVSLPSFSAPSMRSDLTDGFVMEGDVIINVETLSDDEDYEEVATRVMEEIASRMNFGNIIGGMRSTL